MLGALLAKDLRRAWRNPLPWLINLIVPLCVTALIGLAFGGKSDTGAVGRIRFAVVDEDKTPLTDLLRGAANQREAGQYLEPVFLDREAALRQIGEDRISAVLIIPPHFTRDYLTARAPVSLELIKNPAQSIHPTVLQELLDALVTGLNALARNFHSEFPAWQQVIDGKADHHQIAALVDRAGDRLQAARQYLDPPLVSYQREELAGPAPSGPSFNLFAYLLVGMVGMFLLFLASTAVIDLYRELRFRTFDRYHTLHERLLPFMTGKLLFSVVVLALCSAILLGGGALIFRIRWPQPLAMLALTLAYCGFAAAFMAALAACVPDERRAAALNSIAGMILGIAGGCAFPPQQLPALVRDHITPLLPSFWYVDTLRNLQWNASVHWWPVVAELLLATLLLLGLAAALFRRRFQAGTVR